MVIDEVREINREFEELMLEDVKCGYLNDTFWHYEPFSDNYWSQKYKIVLCNSEPYGDNNKDGKNRIVTLDVFKEWLSLGNKTARNSALFLYCLYKRLQGLSITEEELRGLYHSGDELLSVIKNTTYMNLRKEEAFDETPKLQAEEIRRFLVPGWSLSSKVQGVSNKEYRELTLDFIDTLAPDIFIITGEVGCDVLNKIYEGKINLAWQGMYKNEKTLYVSINHPSRISYKYIVEKTNKICKEM
jgi:hypothetical protein